MKWNCKVWNGSEKLVYWNECLFKMDSLIFQFGMQMRECSYIKGCILFAISCTVSGQAMVQM